MFSSASSTELPVQFYWADSAHLLAVVLTNLSTSSFAQGTSSAVAKHVALRFSSTCSQTMRTIVDSNLVANAMIYGVLDLHRPVAASNSSFFARCVCMCHENLLSYTSLYHCIVYMVFVFCMCCIAHLVALSIYFGILPQSDDYF